MYSVAETGCLIEIDVEREATAHRPAVCWPAFTVARRLLAGDSIKIMLTCKFLTLLKYFIPTYVVSS